MTNSAQSDGKPRARELIEREMSRQHDDARASFDGATELAARIAESARRTRRLVLLGMGGSHCVNRAAEGYYRAAGIDTTALILSETLDAPLPEAPRTAIVTSQSGASGEVVRYLVRRQADEERFGLTLDPASPLARTLPSLIGAGGPEVAFAATRSLLVSLALHGAVMAALGVRHEPIRAALRDESRPDLAVAAAALADVDTVILTGRGGLQGIAESGALCLMELARMPALALEGGQFRHGPLEILRPGVGVIALRGAEEAAPLAPALLSICRAAGAPVIVFDSSAHAPVSETITVTLPARGGLAAALGILPPLQTLLVAVAGRRIQRVGEPLRSTKVTVDP